MKIAIMQPYFFPYLGYFQLINAVDNFIIFDTSQYIRKGFINRNKISNQSGNEFYLRIPVKKAIQKTIINNIEINNNENWKLKIFEQIKFYKNYSPYYSEVYALLNEIFKIETNYISVFNEYSIKTICNYLKIKTKIDIWSKMNISIDRVNAADEWSLNICKALKSDTYYNAIGGKTFFDSSKFTKANIDLKFLKMNSINYNQNNDKFIPNLSIIDLMMFNSVEQINVLLYEYTLT